MEPPSASPCREYIPWQGLLLAASLLTLWSPPTAAQLTVESVPSNVAEGKDVLLLVHNLPDGLTGFRWYKGDRVESNQLIGSYVTATQATTPGPAYSQRETIYPNGSLLFQRVTQEDTGSYTLQTLDPNLESVEVSVQFYVYPESPKPFITSNNSHPVEGADSVALTCGPETQNTAYLWWINGQSILDGDRLQLSNSNRTLTVLSVTRNDTGPYECGTQNPVSAGRSDPVSLNVSYGPDVPIISPSDSHFRAGTSLSLFCFAASNPPAQYSWLINGRPQQATQELFIPNLTANHSGSYTCLVYSSVTGLSRNTVKNITVFELVTRPSIHASHTTVTEHASVVLTCLSNDTGISIRWIFNNQSLQLTDRMTLSQDNSTLSIDSVSRVDAGEYQCEVSNPGSSSKSAILRLTVTYENAPGLPVGAIVGIVIAVLVGVALVAALVYFLLHKRTRRAGNQTDCGEPQPPASTPGHGPSGGSTALAPLPGHKTVIPIYEELSNPDLKANCQNKPKAEKVSHLHPDTAPSHALSNKEKPQSLSNEEKREEKPESLSNEKKPEEKPQSLSNEKKPEEKPQSLSNEEKPKSESLSNEKNPEEKPQSLSNEEKPEKPESLNNEKTPEEKPQSLSNEEKPKSESLSNEEKQKASVPEQ